MEDLETIDDHRLIRLSGIPSEPLAFAQPWQDVPESGFQNARGRLHWSTSHLHVAVEMDDREIYSGATGHGQPLWSLGDTLEVFLMVEGAQDYFELHVSPANFRDCLRWPPDALEKVRTGEMLLESFQTDPQAFSSRVENSPTGWNATIDIPASLLDLKCFDRGLRLRLSLSRYEYAGAGTTPVLSTVAAHPVKNFHCIEDWLTLELV